MLRRFRIIAGLAVTSLGVLWTLQGADLIWIKPILCLADCEPLVGGSNGWLIVGLVSIAIGLLLLIPRRRSHT